MCDKCDHYWGDKRPLAASLFPNEDTVKVVIAMDLPRHTVEHMKKISQDTEGKVSIKEAFEASVVMGLVELRGFLVLVGALK
jgi:hypothetical protein